MGKYGQKLPELVLSKSLGINIVEEHMFKNQLCIYFCWPKQKTMWYIFIICYIHVYAYKCQMCFISADIILMINHCFVCFGLEYLLSMVRGQRDEIQHG